MGALLEHLEGRQSIVAALRARQRRFQVILLRQGSHVEKWAQLLELAREAGVAVKYVPGDELDAMTHGSSHGGAVAVCSGRPRTSEQQLLELLDHLREAPLLLLLEGIDDARNLGFTLRSADALGAHGVLIKKHLWDFDPVEVARPASGAYERLPLVQVEGTGLLKALRQRGVLLVGCIAGGKHTIHDVDMRRPTLLAIGGEKRGLSAAVRDMLDIRAAIPTRDGSSSLALSQAASIVLAEAMRQRLAARDA